MSDTYYVAAAGNNANSGLIGSPWQTEVAVMAHSFLAGDVVRFTRGETFNTTGDQLWLVAQNGAAGNQIHITSTIGGGARAIIHNTTEQGLILENCSHVIVDEIDFFGATMSFASAYPTLQATNSNAGSGILVYNTSGALQSDIDIINNEVRGFNYGVFLYVAPSGTPTVGLDDIYVADNIVHDTKFAGIFHAIRANSGADYVWGVYSTNIIWEDNEVYQVWGIYNSNSSYPFAMESGNSTCRIRYNYAHANGEASAQSGANGVTYFLLGCDGVVVYANEAATQRTPGTIDGSAFDVEASANCAIIGNYAWDCDGPALEAGTSGGSYPAWINNVYAFNVCVGNGHNSSYAGFRAFTSGMTGIYVAYNTFFLDQTGPNLYSADSITAINNVCVITGAANLGSLTNIVALIGNTYDISGAGTFSLTIDASNKTSLSALRTAGYEKYSAVNYGYQGSAGLSSPGDRTAQWPSHVTSQTAYNMSGGSSALGTAINPATLGYTLIPGRDFHEETFAGAQTNPGADQVADGTQDTLIPRYTPYTVQASQITGTVTDWPALVSWTATRFKPFELGGHVAHPGAYDLVPYSDAALTTPLPFQREYRNALAGSFIDWVKIPSAAVATTIYYGYGSTAIVTEQQVATAPWNSAFVSVNHFGNGTRLSVADATGLTTPTNHSGAANAGGAVDGCAQLNNGWWVDLGSAHNFTSGAFTISGWFYTSEMISNFSGIALLLFYKGQYQTNGYYAAVGEDGAITFATNQASAIQGSSSNTGEITAGVFYYLSFIRNGASVKVLKNGVDVTTASGTHVNPLTSSDNFQWGSYNNATISPALTGAWVLDECRVSNTNRTVAWELATYKNMVSQATFWGSLQAEVDAASDIDVAPAAGALAFIGKLPSLKHTINMPDEL